VIARPDEANEAARGALAACREFWELYGAGNALNMLMFNEPDLGAQLRLMTQASYPDHARPHQSAILRVNSHTCRCRVRWTTDLSVDDLPARSLELSPLDFGIDSTAL